MWIATFAISIQPIMIDIESINARLLTDYSSDAVQCCRREFIARSHHDNKVAGGFLESVIRSGDLAQNTSEVMQLYSRISRGLFMQIIQYWLIARVSDDMPHPSRVRLSRHGADCADHQC